MPRKRRGYGVGDLDDVNLIPIMSVIVILIPMLIYAFNFFEVTVQSVAAPKMGTGKAKDKNEPEKKPLNLTILVSDQGFMLKYDEELMAGQEEPQIKKREFPADQAHGNQPYVDYDFPTLHNRLAAMKSKFPDEKQVNIGAEMHIPWRIIARVIDSARLELDGAPFEGDGAMSEYQAAKPKKVKDEAQFLFPSVVFVVAE